MTHAAPSSMKHATQQAAFLASALLTHSVIWLCLAHSFSHLVVPCSLIQSCIVRYLYLFPLRDDAIAAKECWDSTNGSNLTAMTHVVREDINVQLVSSNLANLVNKRLDYTAFARDTPPGTYANPISPLVHQVYLLAGDVGKWSVFY